MTISKPVNPVFVLALVAEEERGALSALLAGTQFVLRFADNILDAIISLRHYGPVPVVLHDSGYSDSWRSLLCVIGNVPNPPKVVVATPDVATWGAVLEMGGHDAVPKPWDRDLIRVLTLATAN